MKKLILPVALAMMLVSCDRVAPNYIGVLMENYGKDGKSDFSLVKGRVNTAAAGTELFQVPLWEQRASFEADMTLKAADNTEFKSHPSYSYTVIEQRAVDVVFQNKQLGSGETFMKQLEDNILEMKIRDITKEESRKYNTDSLMVAGGSLRFEKDVEEKVRVAFEEKGLKLESFSAQLEFTDKVRDKIDKRNEVNTNLTVLDQQIMEQKKKNELATLQAQEKQILSTGLTPQILQHEFYEAWKETKQPIYGATPWIMVTPK